MEIVFLKFVESEHEFIAGKKFTIYLGHKNIAFPQDMWHVLYFVFKALLDKYAS